MSPGDLAEYPDGRGMNYRFPSANLAGGDCSDVVERPSEILKLHVLSANEFTGGGVDSETFAGCLVGESATLVNRTNQLVDDSV